MIKGLHFSNEHWGKNRKSELLSLLHRVACIFAVMNVAYWLSTCFLTVGIALQEIEKFEGLRATQPIWYYLSNYYFLERVVFFLILLFEFLVYIIRSRRAMKTNSYTGSILYFAVMLLFHAGIWIFLHLLTSGYAPPFAGREERMVFYRTFADDSILPAASFLILYVSRIKSLKSLKK